MIVLSDCLHNRTDEGCIKVASTLAKRLKQCGAKVFSINTNCNFADECVRTNKLLISNNLRKKIAKNDEKILYIPFASNTLGSAIRLCIVSVMAGKPINVIFCLCWRMSYLTKWIIGLSKANVIALSTDSYEFYKTNLMHNRISLLKTGVDTKIFNKCSEDRKRELRTKYGISSDKTVVLHVGHLKSGRNIEKFLEVDEKYQVLLVFSSVTEKDSNIWKKLKEKTNIMIFDQYIENICELYQLADVYIFPTVEVNNSIDIPLSVLEAAACNLKIISTAYKEIAYFKKEKGFVFFDGMNNDINETIKRIISLEETNTRNIALEYDWNISIKELTEIIG